MNRKTTKKYNIVKRHSKKILLVALSVVNVEFENFLSEVEILE